LLAAYKSLVNLNFAREWKGVSAHRGVDSVTYKPSGLIAASAQHPMDLQGAHAFLGMKHQENNFEPFWQLDVGILENGTRQNAKLIAILGAYRYFTSALVEALRAAFAYVVEWASTELENLAAASRARHKARRPTLVLKERLAVFLTRETGKQFAKGHLMRRHVHTNKYSDSLVRCQVSDSRQMFRLASST
jgi:hypothetical protein